MVIRIVSILFQVLSNVKTAPYSPFTPSLISLDIVIPPVVWDFDISTASAKATTGPSFPPSRPSILIEYPHPAISLIIKYIEVILKLLSRFSELI